MRTIRVRNVHQALPEGLALLERGGEIHSSRNGDVIVFPTPVTTVYERPWECVLFWPDRDANPFFHLMEALWMLAGRSDVEWISQFNSNMIRYSDDGVIFHGAYGHRWRKHFNMDQVERVCKLLKDYPDSRRAVISAWSPGSDLREEESGLDLPCNTQIYVWLGTTSFSGRVLNMTVMSRSNDIIWGAYGSNAVHFSILQFYIASKLGVMPGKLFQMSNNYHAYVEVFEKNRSIAKHAADPYRVTSSDPYELGRVHPLWPPFGSDSAVFDEELQVFMSHKWRSEIYRYQTPILRVASLLSEAYFWWKKEKNFAMAFDLISLIPTEPFKTAQGSGPALDWKVACIEWLERRSNTSKE